MLWPFSHDAGCILEEVGLFHGLESEVVQEEVAFVINTGVNEGAMGFHYRDEFVADIGEGFTVGGALARQFLHCRAERGTGVLLVVADDDARGDDTVIRVAGGQIGRDLRR